ncbi:MAG: hypothetical protein JJU45_11895 [Acidimicrobiia bacterium]|nr:hypothetical protein [Acidimicrobiia bacterium]
MSPRSTFVPPAIHVLHHGRFVDRLPLPAAGVGRRELASLESIGADLVRLGASSKGSGLTDWCPVRIVGGLRGRMGITVAVVDPSGDFAWLIAPEPNIDLFAYLFRRSARRRRAELTRSEAAAQRGCPPVVS